MLLLAYEVVLMGFYLLIKQVMKKKMYINKMELILPCK